MSTRTQQSGDTVAELAVELGAHIRTERKRLKVSAVAAAEAAGMSRVTWHRLEKGEMSVSMGSFLAAANAIGLTVEFANRASVPSRKYTDQNDWIPVKVKLDEFPLLKQLAWQISGVESLSPIEAFDIYERNWCHLDESALLPAEQNLIEALRSAFDSGAHGV